MKRALTVVLFLLFTIGVCVDGNEESVSVTERDSVTLKSGVTEIQTDDGIEWRFSGSRIAKISRGDNETWVKPDGSFRDRLQLDNQTGDLKISNIRTTDSGEYKLLISSIRRSPPEVTFTVKVVPVDVSADEVESVLGLEGFPVTLHTDLTEIQGDDVIQWRFGQQKSPVAEINRKDGIVNTVDTDERFRGRLKLDQTGSLIIKNTRTTDSGLYQVYTSSSRSRHTIHHTQSFSLTVRALPDPGLSPGAVAGIGVGVCGVLLGAAAAAVFYYRYKRSKNDPSGTQESNVFVYPRTQESNYYEYDPSGTQESNVYVDPKNYHESQYSVLRCQESLGNGDPGQSAGSGPENKPILKTEGTKENEYDTP